MLNSLKKGRVVLKSIQIALMQSSNSNITYNFCTRLHKFKHSLPEILINPEAYYKHIKTQTKILSDIS